MVGKITLRDEKGLPCVRYWIDGKEVTEAKYNKMFPSKLQELLEAQDVMVEGGGHWPILSEALGVHPEQVQEANQRNKAAGIAVEYNRKGQAVIPSRGERRKLMDLEGVHDRDGGYGDG